MKLAICVLLCLGTAALSYMPEPMLYGSGEPWTHDSSVIGQIIAEQKEFQYGREYKYVYNGQVMTGIPGTSRQHSGSRVKAVVKFVCKNEETCIMKIEHIRTGKLNRRVGEPRHVLPMNAFDEIPLDAKQRHELQLPLKFHNNKGVISNLVFDGHDKPWSQNIKRGILHMIQVNLQTKKQSTSMDIVDLVEDEFTNAYKPTERDAHFYRTLEETVEGQCETLYTVTKPNMYKSQRQEVFNVTKTVNFEKCLKRPQIKYNFYFGTPCPTSHQEYQEDQKFLKSSSISQYQVIKTSRMHIVKNSHTESEYVFTPLNEEANTIVTYVSQNLKLIKTGVATSYVQVPRHPEKSFSSIVYNLEAKSAAETFRMEGNSKELQRALHFKGQQNKVQQAKHLLHKLVNNIREQVEEPATKHFVQLVRLLRLTSETELDQLHNILENRAAFTGLSTVQWTHQEKKRAQDLFHDAVGAAGTKACVRHLVKKIKQHEMPIVKAVSSIKNLMTMYTPSKEIIEELIKLAESPIAERHYMLKQVTWLTIGSLIESLCSNNEDQWAREYKLQSAHKFCPKEMKEQYVKVLLKKLHSSHKWDDQLIYVKALGNAALDLSVFEIEKIINNKNFNYPTLVRVEAVLALRKLNKVMPKKIQKVLMPVVHNKMQPQTLRIAASYIILQSLPSRPILDQLAKLVHDERSIQVSSFIYSYMESLANSTNPCERKLNTDLTLSLRQTHKIYSRALGNSKFLRIPMHDKKQQIGLDLDLVSTFAEGRRVPRQLSATLHSNFLGFWNKYLVSFRLATEGLEKIIRQAYSQFAEYDGESFFATEYENMFSPAGIFGKQVHDVRSKDPKMVMNLKIKNEDVAFLPIKRHTLESLSRGFLTGKLQAIEQRLRQGMPINFNKATLLEDILYEIPTTIGMPVYVDIKVPMVMNVHGALKMSTQAGRPSKFQVKAALKPSLVASVNIEMTCWSPIVATGVKVISKVKAFKPIDAKVLVDLKHETKMVKVLFRPPRQIKDLVTLETRPYTFTQIRPKQSKLAESPQQRLIINEEGIRMRKVHQCNTCRWLGVRFCVKGHFHKTPEHRETNAPFIPFSGTNKIVISAEPSIASPHTIAINLFGKFFKPLSSWNVRSDLSMGQQTFLSMIAGEQYTTPFTTELLDETMTPFYGYQHEMPIHQTGVDSLMHQSAMYNSRPTRNSFLAIKEKTYKRPRVNSLRIQIEAPQRYTTFDLMHIFNLDSDYHKVQAKMVRSPVPEEPRPWKVCLNAETIFPTLKMIKDLPNGQVLGKMHLRWGQSCSSNKYIHATKRLEKGFSPKTHDLQNPEWRLFKDSNMRHDELLEKSPIKFIFNIEYQNVPIKAKHYANELLRMIKKRHYDQINVAEVAVQNRPHHIKVVVAVDPITLKKCDVLIKTPRSSTLIRDLPIPSYARPITHKHDYHKNELKSLTRETLFSTNIAQCYASEMNVKTFHDRELPLPLSHSYKVLAKDCQQNKYTVLVRQMTDMPQLKEVKIIADGQHITLKPSLVRKDLTKVFVNGKDETQQNDIVKTVAGVPILRIIRKSAHVKVEILTAGVSVHFDRKSVNIEVPPYKRHNQCGICGSKSFSTLRQELPTYLQQSSIFDEIERETAYQWESPIERALEQDEQMMTTGGWFTTSPWSRIQPSSWFSSPYDLESNLRDYSTVDDAMSYYFNYKPTGRRFWETEQMLEEPLMTSTRDWFSTSPLSWTSSPYDSEYNLGAYSTVETEQILGEQMYTPYQSNVYGEETPHHYLINDYKTPVFRQIDSINQAWSRPAEREWELEQMTSKYTPEPAYEQLRDLQKVSAEFDRFYSPIDVLDREMETTADWSIYGQQGVYNTLPWSVIDEQRPYLIESDLERMVDREYFQNPYLRNNYLVDERTCQYLPFWERKMQGCEDIFAETRLEDSLYSQYSRYPQVFGQEEIYGDLGYESEMMMSSPRFYDSEITTMSPRLYDNELIGEWNTQDSQVLIESPETRNYFEGNLMEREGIWGDMSYGEEYPSHNRKQKIIETEHSICFSLTPIKCRDRAVAKDGVKKNVAYHCMNRDHPLAQKYQNEIVAGRPFVEALRRATPTMTRLEVVPVQCQPVF